MNANPCPFCQSTGPCVFGCEGEEEIMMTDEGNAAQDLRAALAEGFCISNSNGHPDPAERSYRLIFSFSSLEALQSAHSAYVAHPPAAEPVGLREADRLREAISLAILATPARTDDTGVASGDAAAMREAGQFLLDRLVDHEVRMTSEDDAREWCGHVTPAMARFRSSLSTPPAALDEGGR